MIVAKWLGRQSYLDDLASLDKDLYKGLISQCRCSSIKRQVDFSLVVLKNDPKPEDMALTFSTTIEGVCQRSQRQRC